jgi:hypothetical protein
VNIGPLSTLQLTCAVPDLISFNPELKNRRKELPTQPRIVRDMVIRDGDGFDGDGIDDEGYNRIGFNSAGLNRAGQPASQFPPEYLRELEEAADSVQDTGARWVAPPIIDVDLVRSRYPRWYEIQESMFPEEDQVRQPF